ncbi:RNA polymerase sigma factor [Bacillus sp. UMB0728]|uniref:RNA polymerase sigma factor n=1 Tax=Bacillus sp. UMB0728 TaxID=2066052 RepID=UPI000C77746B|nr:RNA polymerase sigma factor [Bacillus sp. UMB0728]PLR71148.1 RNA polymerase subunit sigma-70 [Bacillus sp. UMB0728]
MAGNERLGERIDQIYKSHYLDVYRFLICFTGNQNDAEDLTQEVFLRILNNLTRGKNIDHQRTWIFSIAKHVAIDHYRKRRFSSLFTDSFFKHIVSAEKEPGELMEENEMKRIVHGAISELKTKYRTVVILRGINEFSIRETSEILQCSESKVKVDYHRALKILRMKLEWDIEEVIGNAN